MPRKKVWHQTWVDNGGGRLLLEGRFEDGAMRLRGGRKNAEGGNVIDQITRTLLEDGRDRQYWQASKDEGVACSDVFDGYYKKDGT